MKSIVFAVLTGLFAFLACLFVLGFDVADATFLALSVATATASAVALSEREANIGVVVAFAVIAIVASMLQVTGIKVSGILIKLPSAEIVIPTYMFPILSVAFAGLLAFAKALDWSIGRTILFVIGSLAWLSYYMYPTQIVRLFAMTVVTICASTPLLQSSEEGKGRLLAVSAVPVVATIDFTGLSMANLVVPVLLFVAVDPTGKIKNMVRELATIAILSLVLINVVGVYFGF